MSEEGPLILVVDDEPQIRRFLRASLSGHGYRPIEASNAIEALRSAYDQHPDLIILDLGLPDIDGLEVTRQIRQWSSMPIIVLSARQREDDKIAALDAGADDYLTKPFGVGELLARVRVCLRRAAQLTSDGHETVFTTGDLTVDLEHRLVSQGGSPVHLTPTEYRLLTTLIKHAGKVMTHRQLLRDVWGPAYAAESHLLRVHMAQLRHKLEAEPARPRYLLTEPGVGYRLVVDGGFEKASRHTAPD